MLYGLACIAGLLLSVYWLLNGILKLTGWTDPEERKKATIAAMTAAALNSKGAKNSGGTVRDS